MKELCSTLFTLPRRTCIEFGTTTEIGRKRGKVRPLVSRTKRGKICDGQVSTQCALADKPESVAG